MCRLVFCHPLWSSYFACYKVALLSISLIAVLFWPMFVFVDVPRSVAQWDPAQSILSSSEPWSAVPDSTVHHTVLLRIAVYEDSQTQDSSISLFVSNGDQHIYCGQLEHSNCRKLKNQSAQNVDRHRVPVCIELVAVVRNICSYSLWETAWPDFLGR